VTAGVTRVGDSCAGADGTTSRRRRVPRDPALRTSTWAARPPLNGRAAEALGGVRRPAQLRPFHRGDRRLHWAHHLFLDTLRGPPPCRRLTDPGALQGTVTPRHRAQGGDAVPGSYPRVHADIGRPGIVDSRCRPPVVDLAGVKRVARV
jgi:hypothetical protein